MFIDGILFLLQLLPEQLDSIPHEFHVVLDVLELVLVLGRLAAESGTPRRSV